MPPPRRTSPTCNGILDPYKWCGIDATRDGGPCCARGPFWCLGGSAGASACAPGVPAFQSSFASPHHDVGLIHQSNQSKADGRLHCSRAEQSLPASADWGRSGVSSKQRRALLGSISSSEVIVQPVRRPYGGTLTARCLTSRGFSAWRAAWGRPCGGPKL